MRWVALFSALLTAGCAILSTGPGHIDKVLVHYLDGEGRHARGGTLLDRDIFQRELRDNPSRWFYERLGGRPVAEAAIHVAGQKVTQVAFVWDPIEQLLAASQQAT